MDTQISSTKTLELSRAFGYLFEEEVNLLYKIANSLPGKSKIVNVGAGVGTSSMGILERRPDLAETFWTIDINPGGPTGGLQNEKNAFEGAGIALTHNQILGDSIEIAKGWDKGTLDLIIIDGCHTTDYVILEVAEWRKHTKKDSQMLFHDYGGLFWGELKDCVDKLMEKDERIEQVVTYALFRLCQ